MINTDIRPIVKRIGIERGMSQAEIMRRIGKKDTQWSKLLVNPRLDILMSLAELLDCTVGRLTGEDDITLPEEDGTVICPYCHKGFKIKTVGLKEE
jgi:transcriptional regulator with XRE-family HTH domain